MIPLRVAFTAVWQLFCVHLVTHVYEHVRVCANIHPRVRAFEGNYAECLNEGGINHILHCNHLLQFMFAINLLITVVLDILQTKL